MSLRLRLIISIGLALLASLAFGGTIALWDAGRQVETEMRSAIVVAERIAQAAIGGSRRGEDQYQQLEHVIRQFDDDRHVQAMVVDVAGDPVGVGRNGTVLENPRTITPAAPLTLYGGVKVKF